MHFSKTVLFGVLCVALLSISASALAVLPYQQKESFFIVCNAASARDMINATDLYEGQFFVKYFDTKPWPAIGSDAYISKEVWQGSVSSLVCKNKLTIILPTDGTNKRIRGLLIAKAQNLFSELKSSSNNRLRALSFGIKFDSQITERDLRGEFHGGGCRRKEPVC